MAFLDRSTLIVDAVLTRLGRQRLSENAFTIEKFALGDDEIDYALYNEGNSNGPNSYGIIIDNMPIHEAFTNATDALKYKLVTRPVGANIAPTIGSGVPSAITLTGEADYIVISPDTVGGLMGTSHEDFIFELSSDMSATIVIGDIGQQEQAIAQEVQMAMMGVIIRQQYIDSNGRLQDARTISQVSTFMIDGTIVGQVPEYESTLEIGEYRVQNTPKSTAAVDSVSVTGGIDIISTRGGGPTKEVTGLDASDFIINVMEPGIITVVSREIELVDDVRAPDKRPAPEEREEEKTIKRRQTRRTTRRDEERNKQGRSNTQKREDRSRRRGGR